MLRVIQLQHLALILLVVFLQYKLWVGPGGIYQVYKIKQAIHQQQVINQSLSHDNTVLIQQIKNFRSNPSVLEEHARSELGMIRKGETFYQWTD